ncbi:MAG: protein translocase SEC61 complex subunit gamma [Nanoarchaeota archaeon]|nr:protein translocase SEC61 complex subunit gamma [Nanoarchaeota archaeon]MBU4086534.1 protein translocase SEC61 complex subunit gamma [Nanoarchaeota archaeon]
MAAMEKVKSFLAKCSRVWHILRKPSMDEFKNIAKLSAIGVLLIGVIGFLISMVMHIF